jgi:hypothetical protein
VKKFFLAIFLASTAFLTAEVTVTENPGRISIAINGQLFTEYRHGDAPHIYYWPVLGPGGVKMTRSYPMEKVEGEETDHIHQRSMWFCHGQVNGVDFWGEPASYKGTPKHPVGKIEHVKVLAKESGKVGVLTTEERWLAPDGSEPVRAIQTLRVHDTGPKERVCDWEITLTAGKADVKLGETKEGSAGLRIAESMRAKAAKGAGKGTIVNSEGLQGGKVWGQPARWVTMSGPIGEKTYSIVFLDHPSNLRHPTRWHAREYGLFAANPFGGSDMDKSLPKNSGDHILRAGEKLTFKYRLAFVEGDAPSAKAEERWKDWAGGK